MFLKVGPIPKDVMILVLTLRGEAKMIPVSQLVFTSHVRVRYKTLVQLVQCSVSHRYAKDCLKQEVDLSGVGVFGVPIPSSELT